MVTHLSSALVDIVENDADAGLGILTRPRSNLVCRRISNRFATRTRITATLSHHRARDRVMIQTISQTASRGCCAGAGAVPTGFRTTEIMTPPILGVGYLLSMSVSIFREDCPSAQPLPQNQFQVTQSIWDWDEWEAWVLTSDSERTTHRRNLPVFPSPLLPADGRHPVAPLFRAREE